MASVKSAAIILTLNINRKSHVLLSVQDPRWRLDGDGCYEGIKAIENGVPQLLPVNDFKFISTWLDGQSSIEEAAMDRLGKVAGEAVEQCVRQRIIRSSFTVKHPSEGPGRNDIEITYLHARIDATPETLGRMAVPGPGCLAFILVPLDQVFRIDHPITTIEREFKTEKNGVIISGTPTKIIAANQYTRIPVESWIRNGARLTRAQKDAADIYNQLGTRNPHVGVDFASLGSIKRPLVIPEAGSPLTGLNDTSLMGGVRSESSQGVSFWDIIASTCTEATRGGLLKEGPEPG